MTIKSNIVEVFGYEFTIMADSDPDYDGAKYRTKCLVYAQGETEAYQALKVRGYSNFEFLSKNPYPGSTR